MFNLSNNKPCCLIPKLMFDCFVTPWTITRQAPLSMGSPKQEYWSELPFPSLVYLPNPGIWLATLALQAGSLPLSHMLLLLLSCLSRVYTSYRTLCDPIDCHPPGFPVLGFSRQEHWSGLPFPSSMHKSEKWNWSRSVVSAAALLTTPKHLIGWITTNCGKFL